MMQFKVGDYVVHFSYGPGQVVNLEKKQLFGGEARLYYEIMTPKNAVWVPVETDAKATLRSVTSKSDLSTYRQILKSKPATLNKEHRVRHLELTDRLKYGSFQVLCEVVRDLAWLEQTFERCGRCVVAASPRQCVPRVGYHSQHHFCRSK